ncbi:unnamed protein product [Auanema sp. JU1783]|nr:unnamed protein product [Auanema sp. JU1783]
MMVTSEFVEHAALGFAFAVLALFVLAIALIAVVLITISHNCWWQCDTESDPLLEDYINYMPEPLSEPIDTVVGITPKHADIV